MRNDICKITGFVIPSEWDNHGLITITSIVTNAFEKYIVNTDTIGDELVEHIDQQIRADGIIIGEDATGNKIVKIQTYEVLN